MRAAISAVASGQVDPTPLYTDRFKLEELPQAFGQMHERSGGFLKSILVYD
jgi:threonine dehydrogenase-like Zn-dependent dehydrogenase